MNKPTTTTHDQEIRRSLHVSTLCKCPRCNTLHKKDIYWTGNGICRKFCPACQASIDHGLNLEELEME